MSKSIRINKQRGYTVIPNGLLPEGNISARAWGIYAYLLSRPDGWVIHVRQLQKVFTEGREAIYTAMRQLRDAGLLEMESYKEPGMPPKQRFVMADMEELLRKSPDTDSWDTANWDTGNRDTGSRGLNHYLLKPELTESNKEINHPPAASAASRKHLHTANADREKGDDENDDETPTASRRLRSADEKHKGDADTFSMLRKALGRAS